MYKIARTKPIIFMFNDMTFRPTSWRWDHDFLFSVLGAGKTSRGNMLCCRCQHQRLPSIICITIPISQIGQISEHQRLLTCYLHLEQQLVCVNAKLPLNTHELLRKGRWVAIRTGNGPNQATGPLLIAAQCWGQGKGARRAHCRLGRSGCCGGASCLLPDLGGCLKAISIDFCCYSYVVSSKNSPLYPNIQLNCVFTCMFCFSWVIKGSKSSFASGSCIRSRTSSLLQTTLLFHWQCSLCVAVLALSLAVQAS